MSSLIGHHAGTGGLSRRQHIQIKKEERCYTGGRSAWYCENGQM